MSFYLSYVKNIKERNNSNVIVFSNGFAYDNKSSQKLFDYTDENPIIKFVEYVKGHNVFGVEVLFPELSENDLEDGLNELSNYLLGNDNSIGLLTNDCYYYEKHSDLINKYGITYVPSRPHILEKRATSIKIDLERDRYECCRIPTISKASGLTPKSKQLRDLSFVVDEPFN